jgi:hypothetical protein
LERESTGWGLPRDPVRVGIAAADAYVASNDAGSRLARLRALRRTCPR